MGIATAHTSAEHNAHNARTIGLLLIVASLLSILMMAHHPSVATHDAGKVAAEIADKAWIDRLVHGSLMMLLAIQAYCYVEFCSRLGFGRSLVRAGMIGYAIGIGAMFGAALIDGFVISALGTHYAAGRPEELEAVRHLFNLCGISVRMVTSLGVVGMSAAFALWSVALLRGARSNFALVIAGLILATGPAIGVVLGVLQLDLHGAMLIVVCQTLWNIGVGVELLRNRI
jgi:hypothetical protein